MQTARVLRVGGVPADNGILETALRGAGYEDVRSLAPADAIRELEDRQADLLLLDLSLPNQDVVRVLQAAAPEGGSRPRASAIVTGPIAASDRMQKCMQHGAEDYIATPFDANNPLLITRRVQLALQRRMLNDATIKLRMRLAPEDTAVLEAYTNAAGRFVPREFLDNLGRKSLADVRLGDHVERTMSVLFCDIRDFTALSEGLTPQENFNFLNSYLRQVTPVVRSNHGFVDKYVGDGIMALFPRSPSDALAAAVALQQQLAIYNQGRAKAGYVSVRVGIGIHAGSLILGTIGEEERMQTTVISDSVNVASRMEGLTKTFGASVLVSGSVVEGLPDRHGHYLRHLGAVKAKGKLNSVEIFECFDNDPDDLKEHKMRTVELFGAAMAEFRQGYFLSAQPRFVRIAQMNPADMAAAYYRDRCSLTVLRERGPGVWDGAETVELK